MLCLVLGKLYNVNVLFCLISHLQHPKNAYLQHLLQLTMHDTIICRLYSVSVYLVLSQRGVSSVLSDSNNDPPHHRHPGPVPAGVPGAALGDQPGAGHLLPRAVLGQGQTRQPG